MKNSLIPDKNYTAKRKLIIISDSLQLYAPFHCFYLIFLSFIVAHHFYYDAAYHSFVFYFSASLNDFRLWFPDYYALVFMLIWFLKLILPVLGVGGVYLLGKKYFTFFKKKQEHTQNNFLSIVSAEALLLLAVFGFYVALYFAAKKILPPEFFSGFQIWIARGFLFHSLIQVLTIYIDNRTKFNGFIKNYLLAPELPHNIAILRILFFSYLIFIYYSFHSYKITNVSLQQITPLPYIGWLMKLIPVSEQLYTMSMVAGIVSCIFIVVGFKTRFFLLLHAFIILYFISVPNFFGKLWHEQIAIWISWFFAFSKCYDVFSLDALIRKKRMMKSSDYNFPIKFVLLQLGIIYFWAGFYKLWDSGFDWALSRSMINQVQIEWVRHYDKIPDFRIDQYPLLLHAGGLAVILFEMGFIFLLLHRKLKWIAAAGGLLMHRLIGRFMYISFWILLQPFYVFFINFNWFFRQQKTSESADSNNSYSKPAWYFGIFILLMNFLFGMFSVHTYPFSAYPKYSALVPDNIKLIYFECSLGNDEYLNVKETGKKNNFRWETYKWMEYNIIKDFENGEDVTERLNKYWHIWSHRNPELQACQKLEVYLTERKIAPEYKDRVETLKHITTISLHEQ